MLIGQKINCIDFKKLYNWSLKKKNYTIESNIYLF